MVTKKDPWRFDSQGCDAPSAHRRPGYSLSGCTPAEPDSASPGAGSLAELQGLTQGQRTATGFAWTDILASDPAKEAPGRTRRCILAWMPLKKSKKDSGRPRGKCVDFFLLIGTSQQKLIRRTSPLASQGVCHCPVRRIRSQKVPA